MVFSEKIKCFEEKLKTGSFLDPARSRSEMLISSAGFRSGIRISIVDPGQDPAGHFNADADPDPQFRKFLVKIY